MKRTLLLSGAVTAMLGAAPFAMADNAIVTEIDSGRRSRQQPAKSMPAS